MRAEITYQGGKSYWHGKTRFKQDVPVMVTDPATIEHCQQTAGFSVSVVAPPKPKKVVRPVVKEEEQEAPVSKSKARTKSK